MIWNVINGFMIQTSVVTFENQNKPIVGSHKVARVSFFMTSIISTLFLWMYFECNLCSLKHWSFKKPTLSTQAPLF